MNKPRRNFLTSGKKMLRVTVLEHSFLLDDGSLVEFSINQPNVPGTRKRYLDIRKSIFKHGVASGKVFVDRKWRLCFDYSAEDTIDLQFFVSSDLSYCVMLHFVKTEIIGHRMHSDLNITLYYLFQECSASSKKCRNKKIHNADNLVSCHTINETSENMYHHYQCKLMKAALSSQNILCVLFNQESSLVFDRVAYLYQISVDSTKKLVYIDEMKDLKISSFLSNVMRLSFCWLGNKVIMESSHMFFVYPVQSCFQKNSPSFIGKSPSILPNVNTRSELLIYLQKEGTIKVMKIQSVKAGRMLKKFKLQYVPLAEISRASFGIALDACKCLLSDRITLLSCYFTNIFIYLECVKNGSHAYHVFNLSNGAVENVICHNTNPYMVNPFRCCTLKYNWSTQEAYSRKFDYNSGKNVLVVRSTITSEQFTLEGLCVRAVLGSYSLSKLQEMSLPYYIRAKLGFY